MIKEIEDKGKLINLKNTLEEFFNRYDCREIRCAECKHKRLCDNIYRLDTTLSRRYLRK